MSSRSAEGSLVLVGRQRARALVGRAPLLLLLEHVATPSLPHLPACAAALIMSPSSVHWHTLDTHVASHICGVRPPSENDSDDMFPEAERSASFEFTVNLNVVFRDGISYERIVPPQPGVYLLLLKPVVRLFV
ncbi:hypothetical protein ROHU_031203 [Labeo rohita]|uniref:Uncharacterized protein n=1 Tax=Labeo rohita TaxID=84645 RepID=A0A498LQ87_LABRO|nr:hypothetical protein ROHU_031203 [Labeo rohita]